MKRQPIASRMLAIGVFAIGMTEFFMGLLPNVTNDLNVPVSQVGQLITGYALGVAIGGPIVVMRTFQLNHKALLMLLMAIFILGNILGVPLFGFSSVFAYFTYLSSVLIDMTHIPEQCISPF